MPLVLLHKPSFNQKEMSLESFSSNAPASFAPTLLGGVNNDAVPVSPAVSFRVASNTIPVSVPFGATTNPSTAFGSAVSSANVPSFGTALSTSDSFQTTTFGGGATAPLQPSGFNAAPSFNSQMCHFHNNKCQWA